MEVLSFFCLFVCLLMFWVCFLLFCNIKIYQLSNLVQKMTVIWKELIFLDHSSLPFLFPSLSLIVSVFVNLPLNPHQCLTATCKHEAVLLPVTGARVVHGTGMKTIIYIYRTDCHR